MEAPKPAAKLIVEEEEDPLDAFMKDINTQAAIQVDVNYPGMAD